MCMTNEKLTPVTSIDQVRTLPNKRDAVQVEVMSGMGASPEHIAHHLKITLPTLLEHYQVNIDRGQEEANLQVAKTFHDLATSGDFPQATIAWMKLRAGWTEKSPNSPLTSTQEEEEDAIRSAREKLAKLLNRGS